MGSVRLWFGRLGFNPRSNHTKDSKMIFDTSWLNTQHSRVRNKGKWINLGKRVALSLHLDVVAIEKGPFESPSIVVSQLNMYPGVVMRERSISNL